MSDQFGHHLYHRLVAFDASGSVARSESIAATPRYDEPVEVLERLDGTEVAFPLGRVLEFDTDDAALVAWMKARRQSGTPVRVILEGENRHLLWLAPTVPRIVARENESAMGHMARVRLFAGEAAPKIYDGLCNLLARHGWDGLGDLPYDAAPDGWGGVDDGYLVTMPGGYGALMVDPDAEGYTGAMLLLDSGATATITADTPAPLAGRRAAAAVHILSTDIDPLDALAVELVALGGAGAVLARATTIIDSAGVFAATMDAVPSGTRTLRWRLSLSTGPSEREVTFRYPTVRLLAFADTPEIAIPY